MAKPIPAPHEFDLVDWCNSFEVSSPDWSDPVWARRLARDVPRLIKHAIRGRTPTHIAGCPEAIEDVVSEITVTIIRRSRSPKSRWDPARGRQWQGWVYMVARTTIWKIARHERSARNHMAIPQSALRRHYDDSPADDYTEYGGGSILQCARTDSRARMDRRMERAKAAARRARMPPSSAS